MTQKSQKLPPSSGEKAAGQSPGLSKWQAGRMASLAVAPGKKYGRLTVLKVEKQFANAVCDCGKKWKGTRRSLSAGNTKSCGCLRDEKIGDRSLKHGHKRNYKPTKVYRAWQLMKTRCTDSTNKNWDRYGGRGITICRRWLLGEDGKSGFECFALDVGDPPTQDHTLERPDNSKGYSPKNIKWASRLEQGNNKCNNVKFTAFGETLTIPRWAAKVGLNAMTLYERIRILNWPIEKALTTPTRKWPSQI